MDPAVAYAHAVIGAADTISGDAGSADVEVEVALSIARAFAEVMTAEVPLPVFPVLDMVCRVGEGQRAIDHCKGAVDIQRSFHDGNSELLLCSLLIRLGKLLSDTGDLRAAREALQEATTLQANAPGGGPDLQMALADAELSLAHLAIALKSADEVETHFKSAAAAA